jgi:replicative DNA helicase
MSAEQLATRILAEQSRVTAEQIRTGNIGRQEFASFARTADRLNSLPLYIDDTPGLTIAALRARARRLKRQKGIGMVIVDYLQLLQGSGKGSAGDNRVQEISEISRGLKQLAKELDVPVIGLSQLSRAVEQREDKRPQLSDLRESGSIEQDADIVLFIYREEYYLAGKQPSDDDPDLASWQDKMNRAYGLAEIIVAKNRHGGTGKDQLRFEGRFTKFSDVANESRLPERRD